MPRYWVVAPYRLEPNKEEEWDKAWQFDLQNGVISIGWGIDQDASRYNKEQLKVEIERSYSGNAPNSIASIFGMVWKFYHEIQLDDIVIARRGRSVIAAVGTVTKTAYYNHKKSLKAQAEYQFANFIGVRWHDTPRNKEFNQMVFGMQTLYETPEAKYKELVGLDTEHYVQYHNAEIMGVSCDEFEEGNYGIVTNKPVSHLQGNKVWLICGEGRPRKYYLCYWYIVDKVGQANADSGFKFYADGQTGKLLRPPILLNKIPWFADFQKSQQNFRFGLNRIDEAYVTELEKLVGEQELESPEQTQRIGAGFGNPESNRKVEQAAIAFVTQRYKSKGWQVQSVEAEKRGFDLLCTKGSLEDHVEVKGIQGEIMSFIITAGEVRQAQTDERFVLYVVTSAITEHPQLARFSAKDVTDKFDLVPLTFRANLRL